jgi:hypothetical protein
MIYHVFANKSNIGDWLSARGIQSALHDYRITELFCDQPFIDETMAALRKAGPSDFVMIGGGGLFMEYFSPFWEAFLDTADRLSYGIWGVGYCDLTEEDSLPSRGLIAKVIRGSRFCYVRDALTRAHHSDMHLAAPTGCPSLMVLEKAVPGSRGLLHVDNYTTVGAQAFAVMDRLGRAFAAATDRAYRRTNNRIRPGGELDLKQCLELYQRSDIVLSSALHGCLVGLASGCKVVAVSGDRKIDSFMQAVGLSDWVLPATELDQLEPLLHRLQDQVWPGERVQALLAANQRVGAEARNLLARLQQRSGP